MRGAPKPFWAFAALSVAFPFAYFLFGDLGEIEIGAGVGVFMAVVLIGLMALLLCGSRIVWSLLVLLGGATVLSGPFNGSAMVGDLERNRGVGSPPRAALMAVRVVKALEAEAEKLWL